MRVPSGQFLALVGVNGAGKSTLLRWWAGDLAPESGQVRLAGRPLPEWPLGVLAERHAVLAQDRRVGVSICYFDAGRTGPFPYHTDDPSQGDRRLAPEITEDLPLE